MSVELDPARVRSAKSRAALALTAAKRLQKAAAQERAKAEKLAEAWGFYVGADEVGDRRCAKMLDDGMVQCLRPRDHDGECL